MFRAVLFLITLLIAVSSCDSDVQQSKGENEQIREIDWLSGDSLLAALVSVPSSNGARSTVFRLYDIEGNVRQEFFLTDDYYPNNLYVSQDGQQAIYRGSDGNIFIIDIAAQTSNVVFTDSRLISASPDRDKFLLFRTQDNPSSVSDEVYARVKFSGNTLVTDNLLFITQPGFSFSQEFPLLLAGGRVASLEMDNTGSSVMKIRDSLFAVKNTFHLPTSLFFSNVTVPRSDSSFFFVTFGMASELSRFRTDVGFIDPIQSIDDGYEYYAVLSTGRKVIFRRTANSTYILKDLPSGTETSIPNTENAIAIFISPNDKLLAVVRATDEGHKLEIISLP